MTQFVVGYFCGTDYTLDKDAGYQFIKTNLHNSSILLGYNGCQIYGGGSFSFGVEKPAEAFIAALKDKVLASPKEEPFHINLVAHERGALSALSIVKKLQADKELCSRVQVTLDLRDPVPGNLQLTAKLAGNLAGANSYGDISDCPIVDKVAITLQELPSYSLAFDAFVPKCHPATVMEIEALPGKYDVQQRNNYFTALESEDLMKLGQFKTLAMLSLSGHSLLNTDTGEAEPPGEDLDTGYKKIQLEFYGKIAAWAKTRRTPFQTRDLHHGGRLDLIPESILKNNPTVLNWRHAKLANEVDDTEWVPNHVLFGTLHPHYNPFKSTLELACDLNQSIDNSSQSLHKIWVDDIRRLISLHLVAKTPAELKTSAITFQQHCDSGKITDTNLIKAVQRLCVKPYFINLFTLIGENKQSFLVEDLLNLCACLCFEFSAEIDLGKTFEDLQASKALKIAENTVSFINDIFSHPEYEIATVLNKAKAYAEDNIALGRNWHIGTRIILSTLFTLTCTVLGAALAVAIACSFGSMAAPAILVANMAGLIAASLFGASFGLGAGVCGSVYFFKPEERDIKIKAIVEALDTECRNPADQPEIRP